MAKIKFSEVCNPVEFAGYVEFLLIDRETKKVVKHIRQKNQITEPFARWLLTGNLTLPTADTLSGSKTFEKNNISDLLGSYPYQYQQTVTSHTGSGDFGIFLFDLSGQIEKRVELGKNTQIPPYFSPSLSQLSSNVKYYGTRTSSNTGKEMSISEANCRWSRLGGNPSFQTTYVKDDTDTAVIHSVVLGAVPDGFSNGYPAHITVRQSPVLLPTMWDNTWSAGAEKSFNLPAILSDDGRFLIAAFNRHSSRSLSEGTVIYGDGLYAPHAATSRMRYFDLLLRRISDSPAASDTSGSNSITGETFNSNPVKAIGKVCAGGFAIGNGVAIRVVRGAYNRTAGTGVHATNSAGSATGTIVKRQLMLCAQYALTTTQDTMETVGASVQYFESSKLELTSSLVKGSTTERAPINSQIYENNAPVMVARRGAAPEDDVVEVFVSMGSGTFEESTETIEGKVVVHPGGTGIEVQKIVIKIGKLRNLLGSGSYTLTNFFGAYPSEITNYGRVAVLPYAIGQFPGNTGGSGNKSDVTITSNYPVSTTFPGNRYTVGSYDVVRDDSYYLPISHILKGTSLHNWSFDEKEAELDVDMLTPMLCSGPDFQPGIHCDAGSLIRHPMSDCIFAIAPFSSAGAFTSPRIAMLVNEEGLSPVCVNATQRWDHSHGLVMSGLNLDTPIEKLGTQILVVRYTYTFEISPPAPAAPSNFVALHYPQLAPSATRVLLDWAKKPHTERYVMRRATAVDSSGELVNSVKIPLLPPMLFPEFYDDGVVDKTVLPNTRYFYSLRGVNTGGSSIAVYANMGNGILTPPLQNQPVAVTNFNVDPPTGARAVALNWEWVQPTPSNDSGMRDDISLFFARYRLQYRKVGSDTWGDVEDLPADDPGWIDVDDSQLLNRDTGTIQITGLTPGTNYFVRIRAEINSNYYIEVPYGGFDAVPYFSEWSGIPGNSFTTASLPEPVPVGDIVVTRTNYHFDRGDMLIEWEDQGAGLMNYQVRWEEDDESTPFDQSDPQQTEVVYTNSISLEKANSVVGFDRLPYDTWSNIRVQVWPFNDSFPMDTPENAAEEASTAHALYRAASESSPPLKCSLHKITGASTKTLLESGPFEYTPNVGFFDTNPGVNNLVSLFLKPNVNAAANDLDLGPTAILAANTDVLNETGSEFYKQRYIRIQLGFNNAIGSDTPTAVKCIAWKMPFFLRKYKRTGSSTSAIHTPWNSPVQCDMKLYGIEDISVPNPPRIEIGNIFDARGLTQTSSNPNTFTNSLSTIRRPLVQVKGPNAAKTFERFELEWTIWNETGQPGWLVEGPGSVPGHLGDNSVQEELQLSLFMWGIIIDGDYTPVIES